MEKTTKKEHKDESIEYLSFNLSRNQSYYLYGFSVVGFFYCLGLILTLTTPIILPLLGPLLTSDVQYEGIGTFLPIFLILAAIPIIALMFFSYTLRKIKPFLSRSVSEDKRRETFWFGIVINRNQASILFALALVWLFYSVFDIISGLSSFFISFQIGTTKINNIVLYLIESLLFGSEGIVLLVASLYTIRNTRKLKSDTETSEKPLWFGFELEERVRLIIFVGSIIGILITLALTLMYGSMSIFYLVRGISGEETRYIFNFFYILYFAAMLFFLPLAIYSFIKVRKLQNDNSN